MREILFRAYQKNFKRMLPVASIEYHNNEIEVVTVDNRGINGKYDVIPHHSTYIAGDKEFPLDSLVLMQYTGLKDKNGIEVYEGDLIRVVSDPDKPIHEVYFDNEMLEFGLRNSFELFHCQFGDNFEVIGNIHDSRNLLK